MDSTSNLEELNLRVFVLCTLSVAGALPLGIIITSDEKTDTLVQAFGLYQQQLSEEAFYRRGPELGPEVFMTDNCCELRDALKAVWKSAKLMCVSHVTTSMALVAR